MTLKGFSGGLVVVSALVAGGCATSRLEADYGNSFRQAKSNQVLNPEASNNIAPVTGMDGQSAQAIIKTHRTESAKAVSVGSAFVMTPMSLGTGQ